MFILNDVELISYVVHLLLLS